MAFPADTVAKYFQAVTQRNFAEAERLLETLKQHSATTEWSKGYLNALEGMFIAKKSGDDSFSFIAKLELKPENINDLKNEFTAHARSNVHEDYDRGFFSAWTDYMRVLAKWKPWTLAPPQSTTPTEATASQQVEGTASEEISEEISEELPKEPSQ